MHSIKALALRMWIDGDGWRRQIIHTFANTHRRKKETAWRALAGVGDVCVIVNSGGTIQMSK